MASAATEHGYAGGSAEPTEGDARGNPRIELPATDVDGATARDLVGVER